MSEGDGGDTLLNLLAGVGLGALVGAAAALLLAPRSGQETRSQIRGTADDLVIRLRDTVEELRARVDETVASLKSRGEGSANGAPANGQPAGSSASEAGGLIDAA